VAKYPHADVQALFNSHRTYSRKVLPKLADKARLSIRTSLFIATYNRTLDSQVSLHLVCRGVGAVITLMMDAYGVERMITTNKMKRKLECGPMLNVMVYVGVATPILRRGLLFVFYAASLYLYEISKMLYFETFEEVYSHIQSHEVEHGLKYITCSTSVGFGGGDGIDRCSTQWLRNGRDGSGIFAAVACELRNRYFTLFYGYAVPICM